MKCCLPHVLLFLVSVLSTFGEPTISEKKANAVEPIDPFAPTGKVAWHREAIETKPYQLEIAHGELEYRETEGAAKMDGGWSAGINEIDHDFLDAASQFHVAIAGHDVGEFYEIGRTRIAYQVAQQADGIFDLKLHFRSDSVVGIQKSEPVVATRAINTDVSLKESEWAVMGGLTRSKKDGTRMTYSIAVRIVSRLQ